MVKEVGSKVQRRMFFRLDSNFTLLVRVATPSLAKFAPTLAFIATTSHVRDLAPRPWYLLNYDLQHDDLVRLYSTTSGRLVQGIPHPRPVTDLMWRFSQASRRSSISNTTFDTRLTHWVQRRSRTLHHHV